MWKLCYRCELQIPIRSHTAETKCFKWWLPENWNRSLHSVGRETVETTTKQTQEAVNDSEQSKFFSALWQCWHREDEIVHWKRNDQREQVGERWEKSSDTEFFLPKGTAGRGWGNVASRDKPPGQTRAEGGRLCPSGLPNVPHEPRVAMLEEGEYMTQRRAACGQKRKEKEQNK